VFTKVIKMPSFEDKAGRLAGLIKEGDEAQELKVICAGLPNES